MKYSFILFCIFMVTTAFVVRDGIVVDSEYTFKECMEGTKAPQKLVDEIVVVDVEYYSFDKQLHKGQIVVNKAVEEDTKAIFALIKETKFPVNKVVPIHRYAWSDDKSMDDNNSSSFNFRYIAGTTRMSKHAEGYAIDINPWNNPVVYASGKISPKGAVYDPKKEGVFTADSPIVIAFKKRGWKWGGDFKSFKDYHHFQKDK